MKPPVILIVDDEESIISSLKGCLEDEGLVVFTAPDGIKAVDIIKSRPIDIVFLDIWLPEMDGLETLKVIKDFNSTINVVIMTGHGSVNTAVQAVKDGAFDFLEKPFSLDRVIDIIRKLTENLLAMQNVDREQAGATARDDKFLTGNDQSIVKINEFIKKIAATNDNLLIRGETGTGKDFVARLIHSGSNRRSRHVQKFYCAFHDLDELELNLFGSKKGTDGILSEDSILVSAKQSTLFLDSIDTLPVKTQERLADVLKSIDKENESSVRVIASVTTNVDSEAGEGELSKGIGSCFFYTIDMPSLRSRRGDIPILLDMFASYFCMDYGFRKKAFDDGALETLVNYDWPGNVKELKNLVEKLIVSVPTINISTHDIPLSVRDDMQYSMARYYERYSTMAEAEDAWKKNYLLYHLRKNDKNIAKTARKLKIDQENLKKDITEYGIILTTGRKFGKKFQRTLKRSMVLSGTGLHSGDKTGIMLTPLPPDSGIIFGDISSGDTIPADIDHVVSTGFATSLQKSGSVARTIEHFLATLHAYRITNLMVKINNEVPIMDGSAADFCKMIEDAGVEEQDALIEEIVIDKKYVIGEVKKTKKYIIVEPADKFSIYYNLRYPKPVGHQEYKFVMSGENGFREEIAPARTFGFVKDIEALEKQGLASGGRLNNFILVDDEKIVNTELRFPDEFVRHKILDIMGDLYLLGRPIRGKITANMTGHTENVKLVRMLRDEMQL